MHSVCPARDKRQRDLCPAPASEVVRMEPGRRQGKPGLFIEGVHHWHPRVARRMRADRIETAYPIRCFSATLRATGRVSSIEDFMLFLNSKLNLVESEERKDSPPLTVQRSSGPRSQTTFTSCASRPERHRIASLATWQYARLGNQCWQMLPARAWLRVSSLGRISRQHSTSHSCT